MNIRIDKINLWADWIFKVNVKFQSHSKNIFLPHQALNSVWLSKAVVPSIVWFWCHFAVAVVVWQAAATVLSVVRPVFAGISDGPNRCPVSTNQPSDFAVTLALTNQHWIPNTRTMTNVLWTNSSQSNFFVFFVQHHIDFWNFAMNLNNLYKHGIFLVIDDHFHEPRKIQNRFFF